MLFAVVVALFPTLQALAGTWDAQWKQVDEAVTEALRGGFTLRVTMVRENQAYLTARPVKIPRTNKKLSIQWEHFTSVSLQMQGADVQPAVRHPRGPQGRVPDGNGHDPVHGCPQVQRPFGEHSPGGSMMPDTTGSWATTGRPPLRGRPQSTAYRGRRGTPGTRESPHGCCGSLHPRSVPVRHNQEWLGTQPRLFPIRRAAASRSIASFNPLRVPHKSGRLDRTQSSSVACREQRTASSAPSRLFRPSHPPLELNPTAAG